MWKKASISAISLALSLAILEAVLRIVDYDVNPHPFWRYHSSLGWTVDPRGSSRMDSVQPSGFRHSPLEPEKPAGVKRLLVLGDSFALGSAFPYAETLPGRLESWLNDWDQDSRWEVVSLSVDDWGTAQQLIALEEIGLAFRPDAVVLESFPFNDLCNNSTVLAFTCSRQDAHRPYFVTGQGGLRSTWLSPSLGALRGRSRLAGWLENRLDRRAQGGFGPIREEEAGGRSFFEENAFRNGLLQYGAAFYSLMPDDFQPQGIRQGWKATESMLQRMATVLSRERIPFFALVVPFSATFEPLWETLERADDAPKQMDYGTGRFESRLRSLGAAVVSGRRRILDSGMLAEDFFISRQDGHFNAFGHAHAAAWILQEMSRDGVLPPAPRDFRPFEIETVDLLRAPAPASLAIQGFSAIRSMGSRRPYRTAMGPHCRLAFHWDDSDAELRFQLEVQSLAPGLTVIASVNGREAARSNRLEESGQSWETTLSLRTLPGRNRITITFESGSGGPAWQEDAPSPAARCFRLELQRVQHSAEGGG